MFVSKNVKSLSVCSAQCLRGLWVSGGGGVGGVGGGALYLFLVAGLSRHRRTLETAERRRSHLHQPTYDGSRRCRFALVRF